MVFLKNSFWLILFFLPQAAQACPACLVSEGSRLTQQRLFLLGVMGLLPALVAVAVGFRIYRICHYSSKTLKRGD